jgi:hypothetical protein
MSNLGFYLYLSPLCVACLATLFAWAFLKGRGLSERDKLALAWFANYSLANLYFVWCWDEVHEWRIGLLIFSTALVLVALAGQGFFGLSAWRSGSRNWVAYLVLGSFWALGLPIFVITLVRKAQGLSLL